VGERDVALCNRSIQLGIRVPQVHGQVTAVTSLSISGRCPVVAKG
jgi:hypothetical protein